MFGPMLGSKPRSTAVTPITIFGSKLMSWHRGDLGVIFSSGALIETWEDQSGNGRHFYQATPANQPTQTTLGGGQLAAHFDATWPAYLSLTGTSYGSPSALHVFRVMKRTTSPPGSATSAGLDTWGPVSDGAYPWTSNIVYDTTAVTTAGTYATAGTPPSTMAALCIYESIATASKYDCRFNGTVMVSAATLGVTLAATPIIGGSTAAGRYLTGEIPELVVLNAEASAGERTAWAAYILDRYGLVTT